MALADDITEAVALFHDGSQFLHDVATGPATGVDSSVTNPADLTEQITLARAISEVTDTGQFLTIDSIQTATGKKTFIGGLDKVHDPAIDDLLKIQERDELVANMLELKMATILANPITCRWQNASTSTTTGTFASVLSDDGAGSDATTGVRLSPGGTGAIGDSVRWGGAFQVLGSIATGYTTDQADGGIRMMALQFMPCFSTNHTVEGDAYMTVSPWHTSISYDARDPAAHYAAAAAGYGIQLRCGSAVNTMDVRIYVNTAAGMVFGDWVEDLWSPNSQVPIRLVIIETLEGTNTNGLEATMSNRAWASNNGSFRQQEVRVPKILFDTTGISNTIIRPTFMYTNNKASAGLDGTIYFEPFQFH